MCAMTNGTGVRDTHLYRTGACAFLYLLLDLSKPRSVRVVTYSEAAASEKLDQEVDAGCFRLLTSVWVIT